MDYFYDFYTNVIYNCSYSKNIIN
ncbi:arsenate reductase, partial [Francisella tularensis]|nr:arsenate reductase [Francisella tularensis]